MNNNELIEENNNDIVTDKIVSLKKKTNVYKPTPPLNRIIRESGGHGICELCGSTVLRMNWWNPFSLKKCIHLECGHIQK